MADQTQTSIDVLPDQIQQQGRDFVPQGVNWKLIDPGSIDPGHKHTSAGLSSGSAASGTVPVADGSGGVTWSAVSIVGSFTAGEALAADDAVALVAPAIADQTQTTNDSTWNIGNGAGAEVAGQSFKPGVTTYIAQIDVFIKKVGAPADNLNVSLAIGTSSSPQALIETTAVAGTSLTTSYAYTTVQFNWTFQFPASTTFWIILQRSGANDAANYYAWAYKDTTNPYANGKAVAGATMATAADINGATADFQFRTYKEDSTSAAVLYRTRTTSPVLTNNHIGFAQSAVSSGASVSVTRLPSQTAFTGPLSTGQPYYLTDTAGAIGLTPGTRMARAALGKTTTSVEIPLGQPPIGVPAWLDLGALTWGSSGSSQTFFITGTYDFIMLIFYTTGAGNMKLQMNGVSGASYAYQLLNNVSVTATNGDTSFLLGNHGSAGAVFGTFIMNGKHNNSHKAIASMGNGLGDYNEDVLTHGHMGSDANDLSSLTMIPSASITGKARFYGLTL